MQWFMFINDKFSSIIPPLISTVYFQLINLIRILQKIPLYTGQIGKISPYMS